MDGNMRNAEVDVEFTRIKAIRPQIIVTGTVDKPYYEILYYDTSDNVWHIGYSSYNLANVIKWKEECFEVVGEIEDMQPTADVEEVKHGYWANEDFPEKMATMNDFAICSVCNNSSHKAEHGYSILSNYCPNCGADMRGVKNENE